MKITSILTTACLLLSFTACTAQNIKNAKTESVAIHGNCDMCKNTIEEAGNMKKLAAVNWNKDTKMAVITYDSTKTTKDEILKRIALAGYDSDAFLAPEAAYNNLSGCCQYERNGRASAKMEANGTHSMHKHDMAAANPATGPSMHKHPEAATGDATDPLKAVFDSYFGIKDALVNADGSSAASKAVDLGNAIGAVKMASLAPAEHTAWMTVKDKLLSDAAHISGSKDAAHQRNSFASLSANMYKLMQVADKTSPIYLQHCPMYNGGKGADWLSRDKTIKNPYYGSQMLSCGSTTETLR